MNPTHEEIEAKIALLEVQLKLSEAAERAWESSMMLACGEDGPKSVADKFAELESKLETALRECRSAGITIDNLEAKCSALAADNSALNKFIKDDCWIWDDKSEEYFDAADCIPETPATDAFLAEARESAIPSDVMAAIQKVARIRIDLNDFDGDKRGIVDCLGEAEESLIEVVNKFAAQICKGGNQ